MKRAGIIILALFSVSGVLSFLSLPIHSALTAPQATPAIVRACATVTPEPLWVNPVKSPTDLFTQVVTVYIGNGEFVTVSAASGVFTAAGNFDAYAHPALVTVTLLPCLSHQLGVWGKVKTITQGECVYGGYTLYTSRDRLGKPLVITQHAPQCKSVYLPLLLKNSSGTLLLPYGNTCR